MTEINNGFTPLNSLTPEAIADIQKRREEQDKVLATMRNLHQRYADAANIANLHERVAERAKCREGLEMAEAALWFHRG